MLCCIFKRLGVSSSFPARFPHSESSPWSFLIVLAKHPKTEHQCHVASQNWLALKKRWSFGVPGMLHVTCTYSRVRFFHNHQNKNWYLSFPDELVGGRTSLLHHCGGVTSYQLGCFPEVSISPHKGCKSCAVHKSTRLWVLHIPRCLGCIWGCRYDDHHPEKRIERSWKQQEPVTKRINGRVN